VVGAPADTKSFALLVHDPDAPTGGAGWWHWLIVNIPASATQLGKDAGKAERLEPALRLRADRHRFRRPGLGRPLPARGDKPHRYNFTLYSLKVDSLDVSGASASLVGYMINANAIGKAKLTGKFGRKK